MGLRNKIINWNMLAFGEKIFTSRDRLPTGEEVITWGRLAFRGT